MQISEKVPLTKDLDGIITFTVSKNFLSGAYCAKFKYIMYKNLTLIIIFLFFNAKVFADQTLYCSHPELCRMIHQISNVKTENLISISGDPHEYEPTITEIKKLISAPILITGPKELNPWIKKVIFQRSKIPELKTISLLFDPNDYLFYPNANGETLSHFWLYPKVYCSLKNKMEKNLAQLGIALKISPACDFKKSEDLLRSTLLKIKKPIILTHDALLPLFLDLNKDQNHQIVAIKGSGHHEEASPASIKKLYNALNSPSVVWIQETGINIPQNILNKIRPSDMVVKIDTSKGKTDEAFFVLNELSEKLLTLNETKNKN
jgi:ABC-type Zn uptake system ZnuABC Zn-binding protein ZnuA